MLKMIAIRLQKGIYILIDVLDKFYGYTDFTFADVCIMFQNRCNINDMTRVLNLYSLIKINEQKDCVVNKFLYKIMKK